MIVDVETKAICQIDISAEEAFRILCKTLDMDFVLDEDTKFSIMGDPSTDQNAVYEFDDGKWDYYDTRGDLFIALRNVAVNMFPNLSFRNEDYIYNK